MGSNNSSLTTAKTIQSLLTDEPISREAKENIFSCTLSETDVEQVMPSHVIRIMRHYYTHNFALLLYWCITEISDMTQYRIPTADNKTLLLTTRRGNAAESELASNNKTNAKTANMSASQETAQDTSMRAEVEAVAVVNRCISDEQRKRFFNALQMLRRLLPFAFESGTRPITANECHTHSSSVHTNAQAVKGKEREQSATPSVNTTVVDINNNPTSSSATSAAEQQEQHHHHHHRHHSNSHSSRNQSSHDNVHDNNSIDNITNNSSLSMSINSNNNDNTNENVNTQNEHPSSQALAATAGSNNVNTTSPELQHTTSHGPYAHLLPAHRNRTLATMDFAQRFFVRNERCDDDTHISTFPLLPRYMYSHQERSLNNSTTTTAAATSPITAHLHSDETTNETEPDSEDREAIPTSIGAHLM